ncbi:MAG: Fmu (Sun) domain-containing protein [Ferruginibacter sp.]
MRYHSYLNTAIKLIGSCKGDLPFAVFIKKYFAANKKYGGRDRKQISALCYNFYRLGKALPHATVDEKIIAGSFLCEQAGNEFLAFHKPEWNELIAKPLEEKKVLAGFKIEEQFPLADELSTGIDFEPFCNSFFTQPDLFLRIRPCNKDGVIKKLQDAGVAFELYDDDCIALPNSTKIDNIFEIDKEVVVQDLNSQQVLNFLKDPASGIPVRTAVQPGGQYPVSSIQYPVSSIQQPVSSIQQPVSSIRYPVSVWDCCAASGGKSLLLYDILNGKIELTVSDIRETILQNLKKRFAIAGIKNYTSFIADLSAALCPLPIAQCQLIICDAPCTGSGTWSRTPEQLYFFKEKTINEYAGMQQKIVSRVIPFLQPGGIFIYITCSVFKKENEDMVDYIKEKFHLQLLQMELLKGYSVKADSMFTAVFIKQ